MMTSQRDAAALDQSQPDHDAPRRDRSTLWGWVFAVLAIVLGVMGGFVLEPLWRRPALIGAHLWLVMGPVLILGAIVSVIAGARAIGRRPNKRGAAWIYLIVLLALVLLGVVPWFKDVRMRAMGATALMAQVETRSLYEHLRREARKNGDEFAESIPRVLEQSGWTARLADRIDYGVIDADIRKTAVSSDGQWLRIGEFIVSRDREAFAEPGSFHDIVIVGFFPYANYPVVTVGYAAGFAEFFRPEAPELRATLDQSTRKPPKEWMDELFGAMGGTE